MPRKSTYIDHDDNPEISHIQKCFVSHEAIALLLKIKVEDIREVRPKRWSMHVIAKGISTFVSYADMPPIIKVRPLTHKDRLIWWKRWKKYENMAPKFWQEFYAAKMSEAKDQDELITWYVLILKVGFALTRAAKTVLTDLFLQMSDLLPGSEGEPAYHLDSNIYGFER